MMLLKPVPHKEAARSIKDKPAVSRAVFDEMLPELKARAFAVSGIECATTLQTLRDRIADLPLGGDWDDIKADLSDRISPFLAKGDDGGKARKAAERRAELLLRMHGFQAYSVAAYRVMDRQRDVFPWWEYRSMGDNRVRDSHAALDGKVLPASSPFWRHHYPPWEWGCRCQVVPLMDEDVAEIREAEKSLPLERRRVLEGAALKAVEDRGELVEGPNKIHDLRTPSEKGKPGAFEWSPGDLTLTPDQIRERYSPEVWAKFEAWARDARLADDRTVWQWMHGEAAGGVRARVRPASTLAEALTAAGISEAEDMAPGQATAFIASLAKTDPVPYTDKVSGITGAQKAGTLTAKFVASTVAEVVRMLPRAVAEGLPPFRIEVLRSLRGASGNYHKSHLRMQLSQSSCRDPHWARKVIFHETLHWVHDHAPAGYRAAISSLFQARTAGEPRLRLRPWNSPKILGKRDRWQDADGDEYAGRIYDWLGEEGTEVVTRHLEKLADPDKLAKNWNHKAPDGSYAWREAFLECAKIFFE